LAVTSRMFDLGFSEIVLILVIALIVVGPERLPRLARTTGLWIGKIRGTVASLKAEIDHELAADELRKTLTKQASMPELEEIIETAGRQSRDKKPAVEPGQGHNEPQDASDKTVPHDVMNDSKQ
jgi:sec-independent protein translocase protein TatB